MTDTDYRLILSRLAETITWCSTRACADDPSGSIRQPELKPEMAGPNRIHGTTVDLVASQRSRQLISTGNAVAGPPHPLAGGRLLYVQVNGSVWDGASSHVSGGLFDDEDCPGWDSWVSYVIEESVPERGLEKSQRRALALEYLACWISECLVSLADHAILANPVECLTWADREWGAGTRLTQRLRDDGYIAIVR